MNKEEQSEREAWMKQYAENMRHEFSQIPTVYDETVMESLEIMVPMRDGVELRTFVERPCVDDRVPVLLQRSPYLAESAVFQRKRIRELARRGFACVLQCCRGTAGSEGEWVPNIHERDDGIDTVNWVTDQAWAGEVGYYGESYLALTGWAMIDAVQDKVKGMYLGVYGTNRHVSAYRDGMFRQDILTSWAMGNAGRPVTADYLSSCRYRPQIRVDRDLWGVDLPWYRDWITHTDYSDPYWQQGFWRMLREMPPKVHIPVVIEEGWFDHHLGSAMAGYRTMTEGQRTGNCLLRIGAWKHMKDSALTPDNKKTEKLHNETILPVYSFFKRLLIDHESAEAGVSLYVIGEDRWIQADQWPETDHEERLYLSPSFTNTVTAGFSAGTPGKESAATARHGIAGTLSRVPPAAPRTVEYDYDPENPVESWGAESCFQLQKVVGSVRQHEPGSRTDILTFISEPLDQDMRIIGKINVDLYVSSDAADTAFTFKLSEVNERGEAYNIRSSISTLAYCDHSAERQEYHPGDIVRLNLESWDIAWMIRKGGRLRLDISSSDFPQFSIHPNVAGIWSEQENTKVARQTIYCGEEYPSAVRVPVVKV